MDVKFTAHEIEMFQSSIDEWVEATDSDDAVIHIVGRHQYSHFTKDLWDSSEGLVFKISSTDQGYLELVEDRDGTFNGLANSHNCNIALRYDAFGADFAYRRTMMHELGHLYGLDHAPDGVMKSGSKRGEGSDCIHQLDLDQFCAEHTCGPLAAPTCNY